MRNSVLRLAMMAGLAGAGLMGASTGALAQQAAPQAVQTAAQTGTAQQDPRPAPPRFSEIVSRMSEQGQGIMVEAVRKSSHEKQKLRALKAERERILTLIAAPQLDRDALARALERERVLSQKMQTSRHEALLRAATRLSAEDRKIFAEGLRSTRLHIPGETVRQIQQKMQDSASKCSGEVKTAAK